jgi:hypothetical protein
MFSFLTQLTIRMSYVPAPELPLLPRTPATAPPGIVKRPVEVPKSPLRPCSRALTPVVPFPPKPTYPMENYVADSFMPNTGFVPFVPLPRFAPKPILEGGDMPGELGLIPVCIRDQPKLILLKALTEAGERLREMNVPVEILHIFLHIAESNTVANLETCGILCGALRADKFYITTLIVPKQMATSDSCTTMHEEELFEIQNQQDLMTLGWVSLWSSYHSIVPCSAGSLCSSGINATDSHSSVSKLFYEFRRFAYTLFISVCDCL